jgi:hypothetical protein
VSHLIVSPDNPSLLFALTTQSHFARSDDAGLTWKPLPTAATGATTISGIGIEYQNPKVLYFTSDRGIFKSLNQGQTWTLVNPMDGTGITVDFNDANILWTVVGTSSRLSAEIWRSTDGGITWPSHSTGSFGLQSAGPILIDPHDSNTLYVVDDAGHVHRGTRENSWTYIPRPDPAYQGVLRHGIVWSTNSNTLYVGSESPKLYATTNPKEPDPTKVAWKIVSEFGPDTGVRILAHSAPGETLYVTVYTINSNLSKFMKSSDRGVSWKELSLP